MSEITAKSTSTASATFDQLQEFVQQHSRLLVLTGAGISAASGIPTYRNSAGQWLRNAPIQHRDFVQNLAARQRYWARSFAGWPAVSAAVPNAAHKGLAKLERLAKIPLLVTQNVDRLHQRAGHHHVIDLHGRLDQLVCLQCGALSSRATMQNRLADLNPHLPRHAALFPDGDADVADEVIAAVTIPECLSCGGVLKPDVVFFGDAVRKDIVDSVYSALEDSDAMLVIGSSLMVFSGFRFCRFAAARNIPIACINPGTTRADDLFTLKLAGDCNTVLTQLVDAIQNYSDPVNPLY